MAEFGVSIRGPNGSLFATGAYFVENTPRIYRVQLQVPSEVLGREYFGVLGFGNSFSEDVAKKIVDHINYRLDDSRGRREVCSVNQQAITEIINKAKGD